MRRIASLLFCTLCTHGALADEWRSQGEGKLLFNPEWEGEVVPGQFTSFEVSLDTAEVGIAGSRLIVTVHLDSADMGDPDINEAIAGAEWFAITDHAVATYTSDTIEKAGDGGFLASGYLELKGVSLPVSVPFSWSESGDRAEMSGGLVIDRSRFDVGSGEWASNDTIGLDVSIAFEVILERQ